MSSGSEAWQNRRGEVEELGERGMTEPFQFDGIFGKQGW